MALKLCTEYVRGLQFKLRAMGIPVTECTYIHGDNQSVLVNSTQPDSQLKKKSNLIAYHYVREGSALDEWRCSYIPTDENAANMMSKPLPGGAKRDKFTKMVIQYLESKPLEKGSTYANVDAIDVLPEEWIKCFGIIVNENLVVLD